MKKMIYVNEKSVIWQKNTTLYGIQKRYKPDADILIYNGFPVQEDRSISPGDLIILIRRGEIPTKEEMKHLFVARHSPEVYHKINRKTVGIAGAGGLGSTLAISLARLCIGKIVVADFDVVEPSNLNRQQYTTEQIGDFKVVALKRNIQQINPYIQVTIWNERVNRDNMSRIFHQCDVLAECFDNPTSKSEFVEYGVRQLHKPIVAVSGIAGYRNAEKIVCRKVHPLFYIVGDGVTAAAPGMGLMAPKVGIAANLQANKILELLLHQN